MTRPYDHVLFADETNHNQGRYRAVGVLSGRRDAAVELHQRWVAALAEGGVSTLEYKKLKDGRRHRLAVKAIPSLIDVLAAGGLRVDVLCWDTEDARHRIHGRDDRANLGRMYYHCVRNTLHKRWPGGARWGVFIDENALVSIEEFAEILNAAGSRDGGGPDLWGAAPPSFVVSTIQETTTEGQPLTQVPDLFAGLCAFSRLKFDELQAWREAATGQASLFGLEPNMGEPRRGDRSRFECVQAVRDAARARGLGVSLRRSEGLRTFRGDRPLNFWWYEPQHDADKAPVKGA